MQGYKEPSFQDRVASASRAKDKALAKLRAKPPVDEAVHAEQKTRRLAREAAALEKSRLARLAREEAKAQKALRAQEAAEAAAATQAPVLTEAEKKAARDARYEARKNRKK
jgi:soluble lytic murein transglycosylase-like protein